MTNLVGAAVSNFPNFMGANKQFSNFVGAITRNLPGVEIVGPAGGTTEPMICVGRLIVDVVGLTISFPVLKRNNLESMLLCHSIPKLSQFHTSFRAVIFDRGLACCFTLCSCFAS